MKEKDKKDGVLKRLKNIESKIEGKNKEKLEAIKNQSNTVNKKHGETMLLKGRIDYIFRFLLQILVKWERHFLKSLLKMKTRLIIIIWFLK